MKNIFDKLRDYLNRFNPVVDRPPLTELEILTNQLDPELAKSVFVPPGESFSTSFKVERDIKPDVKFAQCPHCGRIFTIDYL